MIYRLLVLILTITSCATAQKTVTSDDFAKTITPQDLKRHLTIIAGPEMEGRNTPSPGLEKAADYITQQFVNAGLTPGNKGSFRQTYGLWKDSVADMVLRINGRSFTVYTDFAPYFFQSDNVSETFTNYVVAGYGIVDENRDDYAGIDVKDKLVVLITGAPKNYTSSKTGRQSPAALSNKLMTALQKGAKAVMIISERIPGRMNINTSYRPQMYQSRGGVSTPIFYINENVVSAVTGHSLQEVVAAFDKGSVAPALHSGNVELQYRSNRAEAFTSNIIGVVEGSDKKDEYLVISAHYDHVGKDANGNIFYGADDDGSGTVAVIEMAEAFALAKKAGKGPRRTVVFLAVSGEEKGLWGSEYYALNPVYPLNKTTANLNIDMIGRIGTDYLNQADAENYVYIIGDDKLSTDLTPITDMVNSKYTKLKLDRRYNGDDPERFYYRSDHYNFARNGVPAIFYFNGVHADYHRITDTVDKINFELMAKRARLIFHTAWEMANREEMLKRDLKLPDGGR